MAKFDWVPYLEGKYLSYYQWFAFIGSFACLVLSLLNFLTYLILSKVQIHQKKYAFFTWISSNNTIISKAKSITFKAGFIFLGLIPLICQALDVIYLIEGIIGQFAILLIGLYLDNGRKNWNNQSASLSMNSRLSNLCSPMVKEYLSGCLKLSKPTKKRILVALVITLTVNLFMYKTCLCFYNSEVGYYNDLLGFGINTCVMRTLILKESCPVGSPCQMYTTLPENPSEAIFLNVHTHVDVKAVDVYYQELLTSNVTEFKKVSAELFPYEGLESLAQRNVHTALISGLKPNTKYLSKVFYNNRFWTNAILKTLPAPGDKKTPIRMINAGDSGYNEAAVNLSKIVAKLKPDVFFMGGDIAYDDNMPACAYTWDYFLGMYGRITATVGYLMPIVATVGNHDVGLNELPGVNITVSNKGPAFHIYFPQHYERNLDGHIIEKVPSLSQRRTMFNFTFGNVHYVALDSGYMHGFDGYQKKFLIDSLEANKDKIKFVNYHVPIYSVCEAFDSDPTRFLYALFHWVPQFDKYHVMASFENHVHSFKRTKPLVGSNPTNFGTVYMGDGAYGAIISEMCKPDVTMEIFEAYAKMNNFWLTEITENKVQHWAYNSTGIVIDHFVQYPQNYTMDTVRGELKESHEITIEKAKKIAEEYYVKDYREMPEQKLPYMNRKNAEAKDNESKQESSPQQDISTDVNTENQIESDNRSQIEVEPSSEQQVSDKKEEKHEQQVEENNEQQVEERRQDDVQEENQEKNEQEIEKSPKQQISKTQDQVIESELKQAVQSKVEQIQIQEEIGEQSKSSEIIEQQEDTKNDDPIMIDY